MEAKDTLLLNKTTTLNPILARRAWFWHVASHLLFIDLSTGNIQILQTDHLINL